MDLRDRLLNQPVSRLSCEQLSLDRECFAIAIQRSNGLPQVRDLWITLNIAGFFVGSGQVLQELRGTVGFTCQAIQIVQSRSEGHFLNFCRAGQRLNFGLNVEQEICRQPCGPVETGVRHDASVVSLPRSPQQGSERPELWLLLQACDGPEIFLIGSAMYLTGHSPDSLQVVADIFRELSDRLITPFGLLAHRHQHDVVEVS